MIIRLDFTKEQLTVFQLVLETTLQSLVYEELAVKNELDACLDKQYSTHDVINDIENLQKYLAEVSPQRVLIAEILHTCNDANKAKLVLADSSTGFTRTLPYLSKYKK